MIQTYLLASCEKSQYSNGLANISLISSGVFMKLITLNAICVSDIWNVKITIYNFLPICNSTINDSRHKKWRETYPNYHQIQQVSNVFEVHEFVNLDFNAIWTKKLMRLPHFIFQQRIKDNSTSSGCSISRFWCSNRRNYVMAVLCIVSKSWVRMCISKIWALANLGLG